ncbi:prepilin peptidase [Halolamina sp. CBA1230]|uniref:A24 family peptidase n=1 Tax=Halolamina sp. CBA1230 TaxID=1853690 RepID=UPI0009A215D0|nr:A24 family peptidase [Halolamina sp. CBA1230]QKY21736.1 prepilin peptidase [Halolamina sp. CBA1230]
MGGLASLGDLARLLAVPLLGWAALRDVRTRRVPNWVWYVLGGLGAVLLAAELARSAPFAGRYARLELFRIAVSIGLVVPLAYLFWRIGGFGGADAKALMALAVLFPTYPAYYPPATLFGVPLPPVLPAEPTLVGVFSLTVLTNTVLVGALFPVALAARNALAGRVEPAMFLARVVPVDDLVNQHGRLFEDRSGFTRSGLDVDALRMYLRWRGLALAELRAAPERYRDPDSVGETFDATDGAVDPTAVEHGTASNDADDPPEDREHDDPWAAERFLDDVDGSAYGTDPETLREGLETVAREEAVWLSPGLPFLVPMFVGLLIGLTYGDLLYGLLTALGLA